MDWTIHVDDFADFLRLELGRSKHTISAYQRHLNALQQYADSLSLSPTQINITHIREFLSTQNFKSDSKKAQSIATYKSFFKFLVYDGVLQSSPVETLSSPKRESTIPHYLTEEEVNRLIELSSKFKPFPYRAHAIVLTFYATGIRVSELCALKLADIYFDQETLKIKGKGNKERLIPISDVALGAIKQYIVKERNRIKPITTPSVFVTQKGKTMQREAIWSMLKSLGERAAIEKKVYPHLLRHTFATHLYQGCEDIYVVKECLGHENIQETSKYTHVSNVRLHDVILNYHPSNKD